MNVFTKIRILYGMVKWRLSWGKTYTDYAFTLPDNPKFVGVRDAMARIPSGAVLGITGIGGNIRCTIPFYALRERFQSTGSPSNLTLVVISGHGGRGMIPGTAEELGQDGLITRLFTAHTETYKSFLKLADAGKLEIQVFPQGTFSLLLAAQARGEAFLENESGLGTFIDPRSGRGTPLVPAGAPQYVAYHDGKLRWTCPNIDVALFNLPAADRKGNLYARGATMVGEARDLAHAARRNGGLVIANVGLLVEEGYGEIFLRSDEVDLIVLHPETEQTCGIPHRKAWDFFTPESTLPLEEGVSRICFINHLLGVTPRRKPADIVLARLAAQLFCENASPGARVDIGVGLPEQVSRVLAEQGIMREITMLNESGVFGGMAAPGIYFGAAVNPSEIVSSAEAFERIFAGLDAAILGALEVDSAGNVNVSKRGEGALNYVGPGGFIDLTSVARTIIFCAAWMARGEVQVSGDRLSVPSHSAPKFMEQVSEITFNGAAALARGQQVYYVTHVGVFELTPDGMALRCLLPGIDLERDVLAVSTMKIVLPEDGVVPVADSSIVSGRGFHLALNANGKASPAAAATVV